MRLSIVVPCFNEEGNIARVVQKASEVGGRLTSELEIIVVDDGSTDDTTQILAMLGESVPELQIAQHQRNRGYGAAVRTGLDRARMDYVFLTDGDGQFDLDELSVAMELLSRHDVVIGYRSRRQDGPWRRLCGWGWTALMNRIFGLQVRDVNCAFKLVPQSLLRSSDLRSDGALISAELLYEARCAALSVGQLAVRHHPRRAGRQSGASLRVIATAFAELIACLPRRWRSRRATVSRSP